MTPTKFYDLDVEKIDPQPQKIDLDVEKILDAEKWPKNGLFFNVFSNVFNLEHKNTDIIKIQRQKQLQKQLKNDPKMTQKWPKSEFT